MFDGRKGRSGKGGRKEGRKGKCSDMKEEDEGGQ